MFTPKEIRDLAARHGMTMLPEDSPEYTSAPQTQFLMRKRSTAVVAPSPTNKKPSKPWMSVTVPWGYDIATIEIGPINWQRICDGKPVRKQTVDWNEGHRFKLFWRFNSTDGIPLWVSLDDSSDVYRGQMPKATVVEQPSRSR